MPDPIDDEPNDNEPIDEPVVEEPDDDNNEPEDEPKMSLEEALAELEKVRKEAAAKRVKLREAESKLAAAKSTEEIEALVDEMRTERETSERALIVEVVATKYNLPPELASRLSGSNRDEIEADAKALAKFAAPPVDDDDPKGGLDPHGEKDDLPDDPGALARRVNRGRRSR